MSNLYLRFPSASPGVSMKIMFSKFFEVEVLDLRTRFCMSPGNLSVLVSLFMRSLRNGNTLTALYPLNSYRYLPCIIRLISIVSIDTLALYMSSSTYQLINELLPAEWFPIIITTSFLSGAIIFDSYSDIRPLEALIKSLATFSRPFTSWSGLYNKVWI